MTLITPQPLAALAIKLRSKGGQSNARNSDQSLIGKGVRLSLAEDVLALA